MYFFENAPLPIFVPSNETTMKDIKKNSSPKFGFFIVES